MANLTREDLPPILEKLRQTGEARLRAHKREFNELEFLFGAATVFEALAPGEGNGVSPLTPPMWLLGLPVGRSWVDPDGEIAKALGFIDCVYCSKPAEGRYGQRTPDGDRLCLECYKEEYD